MKIYGCPRDLDRIHQNFIKKAIQLGYSHLDIAWRFPSHQSLKKLFPEIPRSDYKVIMKVMIGADLN